MNDMTKQKNVGNQYNYAMEISQRVVQSIMSKDKHQINNILSAMKMTMETMNLTKGVFENGKNFSSYYQVVDLFSNDDTTWKEEKKHVMKLTDELSRNIHSIDLQNSLLFNFYSEIKTILKVQENNESDVISDVSNCLAHPPPNPMYSTTYYSFNNSNRLENSTPFDLRSFDEPAPIPNIEKRYLQQEPEDQIPVPTGENRRDLKRPANEGRRQRLKENNKEAKHGNKIDNGHSTVEKIQTRNTDESRRKVGDFYVSSRSIPMDSGSGYSSDTSTSFDFNPSYTEVPSYVGPSYGYTQDSFSGSLPYSGQGDTNEAGVDMNGGVPFHYYQCTYENFLNFEEFMNFIEKYDMYNSAKDTSNTIMNEVNKWKISYNKMIENIFENSYINVGDFPEHRDCLKALIVFDNEFEKSMIALTNNVDQFYFCFGDCLTQAQELLKSIVNFPLRNVEKSKTSLNKCNWVENIWTKETGGRYSNIEGSLASVSQHSQNIKTYFKHLVKNRKMLPLKLQTVILPRVEILEAYTRESVTKETLAKNITSRTLDRAIMDIVDLENKIESFLYETVNSIDLMWTAVANLYQTILAREIPMIKPSGVLQLEFPKIITIRDPTKQDIFLNSMQMDVAKYVDAVVETFKVIFEDYSSVFDNIKAKQVDDVLGMVSYIDELRRELQRYLTSLKMDEEFIM